MEENNQGMKQKHQMLMIGGVFAGLIILTLLILVVIYLIWYYFVKTDDTDPTSSETNGTNSSDSESSTFTSFGFKSKGTSLRDADLNALVWLYKQNKKLRSDMAQVRKYNIGQVRSVYQGFLQKCKGKKTCPTKIYNKAMELLAYIDTNEGRFEITEGLYFREVRLYINTMDRLLHDILSAVQILGDSQVANHFTEVCKEINDVKSNINPYEELVNTTCAGDKQIASQIVEDIEFGNYAYNNRANMETNDWIDANTPQENKSMYEIKLEQGRLRPFQGCFEDMTREVDRQIIDSTVADEDRRDIDTRYPKPGIMGVEFDSPTVSDYRGRFHTYTYA